MTKLTEAARIGERLEALRKALKEAKVDGILITSQENRRYFSGFTATDPMLNESSGALLILPEKAYLLTDGRYVVSAADEAPGFGIVTTGAGGLAKSLEALIEKPIRLAFEPDYVSVSLFHNLAEVKKITLEAGSVNPSEFRKRKSPEELSLIAKALEITEKAVGWLFERLEIGWTEAEAAWFLDSTFRELGAQGPAFETIVASGPQAALPHAVPGDKKIEKNEFVVIDCGARYEGYAADITRTFFKGEPEKWQRDIYRTVREAQLKAISAIKPGVPCKDIDLVARSHIAQAGYGDFFNHSLGHGLGLAVHEAPNLGPHNQALLFEGAVVTVEPGIYLPGKGGVRLEQLIHVGPEGAQVLNKDERFYDF